MVVLGEAVAWLERAPLLGLVALDGRFERVELPPALAVAVPEPAGLEGDVVKDEHRPLILRALAAMHRGGHPSVADLDVDGGGRIRLHFVDARAEHGVVLVAVTPPDVDGPGGGVLPAPRPPRVAWTRMDQAGVVLEASPAATAMLGFTADDLVGRPSLPFVHPEDQEAAIGGWLTVLADAGDQEPLRVRHAHADGSWLWVEATYVNRLDDPDHRDVWSQLVDVSAEVRAAAALQAREQLLDDLVEGLPLGVARLDERGVVHENGRWAEVVGGSGLRSLLAALDDVDRARVEGAVAGALQGQAGAGLEVRLGGGSVVLVSCRPLGDGGALACVVDVTEPHRLRRELERRATVDDLTGCLTRRAALEVLDHHLQHERAVGVAYADLDRFKQVNDAFGHRCGDQLLAAVAERLRSALRDVDVVGRLGGDEFLVVCPGLGSTAAVDRVVDRLRAAVEQPLVVGAHLLTPSITFGGAWAPRGTASAELVARADAAMYLGKGGPRPAVAPSAPVAADHPPAVPEAAAR